MLVDSTAGREYRDDVVADLASASASDEDLSGTVVGSGRTVPWGRASARSTADASHGG